LEKELRKELGKYITRQERLKLKENIEMEKE
jgi:hypothetical protein